MRFEIRFTVVAEMVERIATCTSQVKASTSVALGRQMLRTSAPYMARSRPIAPPAIACPIPDARTPSNGFFPSFWEGMGSLSPIFSTVIKGIVERTSVYCAGSRNSPPDLSPAQGMSLNYVWLPKCTAGLRNHADVLRYTPIPEQRYIDTISVGSLPRRPFAGKLHASPIPADTP